MSLVVVDETIYPTSPLALTGLPLRCGVGFFGDKMKTCSKCKEAQPLSDFSKDKAKKDGHCYFCRTCMIKLQRAWRARNLEKTRQGFRDWAARFPEKSAKWKLENKDKVRATIKKSHAKYAKNNPEIIAAWKVTKWAVANGHLVKDLCHLCGNIKVEAHHEDYNEPLMVFWLCRKHHVERHNELKRIAKTALKPTEEKDGR